MSFPMERLELLPTVVGGQTAVHSLILFLFLLPILLGMGYYIPSECGVGVYLPPMPGTPHPTDQVVSMIPDANGTFRLSYGTNHGSMTDYSTGGAAGQAINADVRGEFSISGLSSNTQYYWRVECSEDGRWKRGWDGGFVTMPASGGTVKVLIGTDGHYIGHIQTADAEARTQYGFQLMREFADYHAYLDLGDSFHIHCRATDGCAGLASINDDFGRSLGSLSITSSAATSADEDGYAEARYSTVLRRMWPALRWLPSMWARGNHDVGGAYGDFDGQHWQHRARPWVTSGVSITLGIGNELSNDFVFSDVGHPFADGDGPYRFAPATSGDDFSYPVPLTCDGVRPTGTASNEYYVRDLTANTFGLSIAPAANRCTGITFGNYGLGIVTLLRGSDMQSASHDVIVKYLPKQNTTYPHGWGSPPGEIHIAGEVPFSDYIVVLKLDPYESTPQTCVRPDDTSCFPSGNRDAAADGGWSLGVNQQAGALAVINSLCVGGGSYPNAEVLLVQMHQTLGGHMTIGYPYARGTVCEVDTRCGAGGAECVVDSDCAGSDVCDTQDCTDSFAQPEWEAIQGAMASFVARCNGIALVLVGHDHQVSFGEKGNSGVYYLTAGRIGSELYSWLTSDIHRRRYDFDGDGIAAYERHFHVLGEAIANAGDQNFPVEVGTEHSGVATLQIQPAAGASSGKTEILLDYVINSEYDWPGLQSHSAGGFPLVIQGD